VFSHSNFLKIITIRKLIENSTYLFPHSFFNLSPFPHF
jgi:hypothetical protein